MLIDTHKAVKEITEAGASEQLAEALVGVYTRANEQVATKEDLEHVHQEMQQDLEQLRVELEKEIRGAMIRTTGYTTAAVGLLLTLFEFAL